LRAIFNAPHRTEAERSFKLGLQVWRKQHPKLAEWAKTPVAESLTVFDFPSGPSHPAAHQRALHASTGNCAGAPASTASSPSLIPACASSPPRSPNSTTNKTHKVYLNFNP